MLGSYNSHFARFRSNQNGSLKHSDSEQQYSQFRNQTRKRDARKTEVSVPHTEKPLLIPFLRVDFFVISNRKVCIKHYNLKSILTGTGILTALLNLSFFSSHLQLSTITLWNTSIQSLLNFYLVAKQSKPSVPQWLALVHLKISW